MKGCWYMCHSAARCEIDIGRIERLASEGRATYLTSVPQAGTKKGYGYRNSTMQTYAVPQFSGHGDQLIHIDTNGMQVNV